jgi:hypothetical protein
MDKIIDLLWTIAALVFLCFLELMSVHKTLKKMSGDD